MKRIAPMSTLKDEENAYTAWGWTWTPDQLPVIPNGPYNVGSGYDVHGDFEADDLWQNAIMWQRTGVQGYYDLAQAWAVYYRDHYLTEYQADLNDFFGDHTFGWGLVLWSQLTGDVSYMNAANDIGDTVQAAWVNFTEHVKDAFYGERGPGRILKLAVALSRCSWADQIWAALRDSVVWNDRTVNGVEIGFWAEDPAQFTWATGATGAISSFEFAVLFDGLSDYYDMSQDPEVKRRLVLMANFAKVYGLDPTTQYGPTWWMVDFPTAGSFFGTGLQAGAPLQPFYTSVMVDVLTRAYQLTGDQSYLARARYTWDRFDHGRAEDVYPYTNPLPAGKVGSFMNTPMHSGGTFYLDNGTLTYAKWLFAAVAATPPPPADQWKILPNSSLRASIAASSWIVSPGPDGWSNPPDNMVTDWNGGIVANGKLILPAVGGHTSWFYNDVWEFDPASGWSNRRKSFLPYVPITQADSQQLLIYSDNSPATVHTYDGIASLPNGDVFVIGGPAWGTLGWEPPPRRFNLSTNQWTFGTSQNYYPQAGTCCDVDANGIVYIRMYTQLLAYDPVQDKYLWALPNITDRSASYWTALLINGVFYMFGNQGVWAQDLNPNADHSVQVLTLTGDPLPAVGGPGVAWEPALDQIVYWPGDASVYLINLQTKVVTKRTAGGDNPGLMQLHGTYKRFGRIGPKQYLLMNTLDAVHQLTLS